LHKIFSLKTKFITRIIIQIDEYLREGVEFSFHTDNLPNLAVPTSRWKLVTSLQREGPGTSKKVVPERETSSSSLKEGQH